jgi:hypothetical protein
MLGTLTMTALFVPLVLPVCVTSQNITVSSAQLQQSPFQRTDRKNIVKFIERNVTVLAL